MKFILDSVNSQGLPSYEDVTGMGDEENGKTTNTSQLMLINKI
jgi:hypothetical protein